MLKGLQIQSLNPGAFGTDNQGCMLGMGGGQSGNQDQVSIGSVEIVTLGIAGGNDSNGESCPVDPDTGLSEPQDFDRPSYGMYL